MNPICSPAWLSCVTRRSTAVFYYPGLDLVLEPLTAFTEPQESTSSTGLAAQSAAVSQAAAPSAATRQTTLAQLISTLPNALQSLASPASSGSGVSGMLANQTEMNVIGNNIANVNTVAFKAGRVTFKEGPAPPTRLHCRIVHGIQRS